MSQQPTYDLNNGKRSQGSYPERVKRNISYSRRKPVIGLEDAYTYALRTTLLAHLLQPRSRRLQYAGPQSQTSDHAKSSSTFVELVKEFSPLRDSKSTKFPSAFPTELDKRITGILIGKERMPEYNDAMIKRTFAAFLNEFKNPVFRKSVEKDRRVEDLLLIFFSKATNELQKGRAPDDDGWKSIVDRHVALFVRLISSTLKTNDWLRDKPELSSRLGDLETKLLSNAQDLGQPIVDVNGNAPIELPISFVVYDMPGTLQLCSIFGKSPEQVQADIDGHKEVWTPEAALQDLKQYQANLGLKTKRTLNSDSFDVQDAYESWKKGESHELSQMMLNIIQTYPDLARHTSSINFPTYRSAVVAGADALQANGATIYPDLGMDESSLIVDQPVDLSYLSISEQPQQDIVLTNVPYTFIPPEPRSYYAAVARAALNRDLAENSTLLTSTSADDTAQSLLSKASYDILNEIALRWRIPPCSRLVTYLDVIRTKFQDREMEVEVLERALSASKEQTFETKRPGKTMNQSSPETVWDRSRWTLEDYAQYQDILSTIHETLLRELLELLQYCYMSKPPSIGVVVYVLNNHIYPDPLFSKNSGNLEMFREALEQALHVKAREAYSDLLAANMPESADQWEFSHVIAFGKALTGLIQKIRKRYKQNPEIMGVSPLKVLGDETLPLFAADVLNIVQRVINVFQERQEQIDIEEAFEIYKEMASVCEVYQQLFPQKSLDLRIEDMLEQYVWKWINTADENMVKWVEQAVLQDTFKLATNDEEHRSDIDKHTSSALDMFTSFGQSIEQIIDLRWNDRLQNAKFLTALSKSVGTAVCKYCELVEAKFIKEMEPPPAEQEALARQTRQEKWMQMARDTLTTKEKIEPFQFVPETLVKLNDIEYTTGRLDKLEKDLDVDTCAAIIQANTPQIAVPKPAKSLFTIKIIEAEDLKPSGRSASSDPYVVLGDEFQKRLAKTRVINDSLSPRWDETVDVILSGPLNIIATVWDWDYFGHHNCIGRTTLKLDPAHFNDFMPREYWLDLDTQGRLLLRVSMEGEKDDIQFYFGRTFRQLRRTERDMTRKITEKLSAYIQYCISRRTMRVLLGQTITVDSVKALAGGYLNRVQGKTAPPSPNPQQVDAAAPLVPLFQYFDANFALMKETLTSASMLMVMTRLWKESLMTIEALLVPPLSERTSQQKQLSSQEFDIVFKWLKLLFDFFYAEDEGVPLDVLRSPKYHDLQNLAFFYHDTTENLINASERMAAQTTAKQQARLEHSLSAPTKMRGSAVPSRMMLYAGEGPGIGGLASARRSKSIMLSRNLGTIKKVKEEKRKEVQAEPSDDMILRILRMRPEAERYLKDRNRQKERLAAHAAAEAIVRSSILAQRKASMSRGR